MTRVNYYWLDIHLSKVHLLSFYCMDRLLRTVVVKVSVRVIAWCLLEWNPLKISTFLSLWRIYNRGVVLLLAVSYWSFSQCLLFRLIGWRRCSSCLAVTETLVFWGTSGGIVWFLLLLLSHGQHLLVCETLWAFLYLNHILGNIG